jgi:EAL domain-containing protein (putative c-di-GMP-specific phosphodiesterase class I)/CheY-like chemotaxis protein
MTPERESQLRILAVGGATPDAFETLAERCEVVPVADAGAALDSLRRREFDLVLVQDPADVERLAPVLTALGSSTPVVWNSEHRGKRLRLAPALRTAAASLEDARLRRAIANGELRLHYQPQLSAQDGRIVGVEALVRWLDPIEGLLSPARFLPQAERSGSIVDLGRWVLNAACADARRWLDQGREDLVVAVNVSAAQLQRPGLLLDIQTALEAHRVPPQTLALELTEATAMGNVELMRTVSRALRDLGVKLVLDDFGVGASNLSSLRGLQVEGLKIDTSFVRGVDQDAGQAAIARAILELAHALGIRVVAEGVETEAELGYLRRNHCERVQGYLFSPPVPSEAIDEMLRQRVLRPEVFAATPTGEGLLLVDDEENVLRSLVRVFRRDGYRVLTATKVEEAFQILAREPVQVIVSDQRMPGTSGTEFLSRVKEMYPHTVRMVLSGYTDLTTVTDAINRGAIYRFLTKPWDDEELRGQVRDAFRAAKRGRSG